MGKKSWVWGGAAAAGLAGLFSWFSGDEEQKGKPEVAPTNVVARSTSQVAPSSLAPAVPAIAASASQRAVVGEPRAEFSEDRILGQFFRYRVEKCSKTDSDKLDNIAQILKIYHNADQAADYYGAAKKDFVQQIRDVAYRALNQIPSSELLETRGMQPLDAFIVLNKRRDIFIALGMKEDGSFDIDYAKQMTAGYDFKALKDKMKELYPAARGQAIDEMKKLLEQLKQNNGAIPSLNNYEALRRMQDIVELTTTEMEYAATGTTSTDMVRDKGLGQEQYGRIYSYLSLKTLALANIHYDGTRSANAPTLTCQ